MRGVREAVEAAGARLLHLPPCPPAPDPTERLFTELKALLRRAARCAVEGLRDATGQALDAFGPDERADYPANSGYAHP